MSSADEAGKINLNTASCRTTDEIKRDRGIQSSTDYFLPWEKNGAFKKIEDIMNITGIKEGVFGKIKDDITV